MYTFDGYMLYPVIKEYEGMQEIDQMIDLYMGDIEDCMNDLVDVITFFRIMEI